MPTFQRYVLRSVIIFLMINVAGLWTVTYLQMQKLEKLQRQSNATQAELETWSTPVITTTTPALETPGMSSVSATSSPNGAAKQTNQAILQINSDVQALEKRLDALEAQPSPVPTRASTSKTVAASPAPRETILFLGTGSSTDTSWSTVPGASIQLNTSDYPGLKSVTFEAALAILGGEASARLINTTTGAVYYQSVISHNTSTPTWKTSASFSLPSGTAIYQVQIRSSSREQVDLSGSRLRLMQ